MNAPHPLPNAPGAAQILTLINRWQRGFPLVDRPFEAIAAATPPLTERDVIAAFQQAQTWGWIDRVGPVWAPRRLGWSTLAAAALPEERLDELAKRLSRYPEVNHNYARSGAPLNLWFVLTAASEAAGRTLLAEMAEELATPLYPFPLVREFHIDLAFDLANGGKSEDRVGETPIVPLDPWRHRPLSASERRLIARLSDGLPIAPRPYHAVAESCGIPSTAVVAAIARWLGEGTIRRLGAVVRHRALGWTANAMAVWAVAPEVADAVGPRLAQEPAVHLCYRREPVPDVWPYTLYAMVHGRDRDTVAATVVEFSERLGLAHVPHRLLFSTRCFKQTGARYVRPHVA